MVGLSYVYAGRSLKDLWQNERSMNMGASSISGFFVAAVGSLGPLL